MYQFLDRFVTALTEPDRFMLAAIRQWVAAAASGRCACAVLAGGFEHRGVARAARDFAIAMAALHVDGRAKLSLGVPGCATVNDDEARLLAVFATARMGDEAALMRMAGTLVRDEAAVRFATAARMVGHALAEAGA